MSFPTLTWLELSDRSRSAYPVPFHLPDSRKTLALRTVKVQVVPYRHRLLL